ncbi:MAG: hypothetical protein ABWX73_03625 [Marmoricola sp.]
MSTALSWTELRSSRRDLAALLAFRSSALTLRARRRLRLGGVVALLVTIAVAVGPAYVDEELRAERGGSFLALLPSLCVGFLVLAIFTAVASAGGREVVPRDQAVAFPVSTTTDHLGALLLAPLNIAWVLQAWTLLGITSYALGPHRIWAYELPVVLWVLSATAIAQAAGWLSEGVRRGPHGIVLFRVLVAALALGAGLLVVSGHLVDVLDHSPTRGVLNAVLAASDGQWGPWAVGVLGLAALGAGAAVVGALPAGWALRRPMREEQRLESGRHPARPTAGSDLMMMLRIDRAGVWRSVPLRRGILVLALMPGAVAVAGDLEWQMLTVLPGLVASGAALLFGVNAWCLDGRGALWRESLPVSPGVAFAARSIVLFEVLLCSALATLALAAVRAGRPTATELTALVCSTLVVALQVVAASMRWSMARPFSVDLRSARATPAPPVVMAGYSARLALATTMAGLVFSGLAALDSSRYAVSVALVWLLWSAWRLARAARLWANPVARSRVVSLVTGG